MTIVPYEPRAREDVPWNGDREKRVLDGALRSRRRRERQKRMLEVLTVACGILMIVRFLPRPPMVSDGTGGALGASAAERVPAAYVEPRAPRAPAIALPEDLAARTRNAPTGFAGTGGHGGGGGHGIGGGAGTG
jgi:hypothetical protein